jgi:glycosyltransferase involved in cell wall biosynthesis
MVPTHRLAQELSSAGFQNLSVVARGVDARQFHPSRRSEALRNSWGASPSTQVVIGVGRLAPEKNLDTLVAAFQGMRRRNPDTKLVLVGDGPCRAKTESKCPEAIFAGMRSGQDLATHYASADVLLFPSITETYGNVTLEAMASGLAVVAYDYAAASQLIDQGQSGFLARYNDTADFLRLAEEVATSKERVRRLGEKGRIRAETMDWESIIHQVEEHYFKVIQRQPKRHSIPASDMVLAG